CPARFAALFC
nr:Chain B, CYS-PRO-ALA-ARG-PHE-M70-ALA-LEU-PHE-CYS [synthetic construct]